MSKIHRCTVHQWTPADDAVDTIRFAFLDGIIRNAPTTNGSMKPDAADLSPDRLLHDFR